MKKSALSNWILIGVFASLCGVLALLSVLSDETEAAGSLSMSGSFPPSSEPKVDAAELFRQGLR